MDPHLIISSPENAEVILLERGGNRRLEVIASPVSVYYFLMITQGTDLERPVIHQAMIETLNKLGAKIERVVVDNYVNDMFLCHVYVKIGEQTHTVAVHVTDAVALAAVQGCPLFVQDDLFKKWDEISKKIKTEISDEEAQMMLASIDPDKPKS